MALSRSLDGLYGMQSLSPTSSPTVSAPTTQMLAAQAPAPTSTLPEMPAYLANALAALPPSVAASIGLPVQDAIANLPPSVATSIAGPQQVSSRIGTVSPAEAKATEVANTLGIDLGQPTTQALPSPDASSRVITPAAAQAIADLSPTRTAPDARITDPAADAPSPGAQLQAMTPPNQDTRQLTANAKAAIDAWKQRQGMTDVQRMASDRGVFASTQHAAAMPGLPNGGRLNGLYGGG